MSNDSTQRTELDEIIDGFTAVRAFLEEHPDLPPVSTTGYGTVNLWLHRYTAPGETQEERDEHVRAEFARCARILMAGAPIGSVTKDASTVAQSIDRAFGPITLSLHASREAVCERRVIGVEKVRVPDPNAPTVEVEREIVEWECTPILGTTDAHVAHYAALAAAAEDEKAVSA